MADDEGYETEVKDSFGVQVGDKNEIIQYVLQQPHRGESARLRDEIQANLKFLESLPEHSGDRQKLQWKIQSQTAALIRDEGPGPTFKPWEIFLFCTLVVTVLGLAVAFFGVPLVERHSQVVNECPGLPYAKQWDIAYNSLVHGEQSRGGKCN